MKKAKHRHVNSQVENNPRPNIPAKEPGEKRPERLVLEEFDEIFAEEDAEDFAMADMHAIKEILMLDPNDIEFRQRHAELIDTAA